MYSMRMTCQSTCQSTIQTLPQSEAPARFTFFFLFPKDQRSSTLSFSSSALSSPPPSLSKIFSQGKAQWSLRSRLIPVVPTLHSPLTHHASRPSPLPSSSLSPSSPSLRQLKRRLKAPPSTPNTNPPSSVPRIVRFCPPSSPAILNSRVSLTRTKLWYASRGRRSAMSMVRALAWSVKMGGRM